MTANGTVTNEQPMPTPGRTDITPIVRSERQVVWPIAQSTFLQILEERVVAGRQEYPEELTTDNGRDVYQDLMEELIDGWQYAVQALLEHKALVSENARLRAQVILLGGTP